MKYWIYEWSEWVIRMLYIAVLTSALCMLLQVDWEKVGGILSQSAVIRGSQLIISPVTAADAGRYRCIVTTQQGTAEGYSMVFISSEFCRYG